VTEAFTAAVATREEQEPFVCSAEAQRVEDAFVDALSEAIIAQLKRAEKAGRAEPASEEG
jgi:hypothetical protein